MSTQDYSYETHQPVRIGAGSFATVYAWRGGPLAFKVAAAPGNCAVIHQEFEMLRMLYAQSSTASLFRLPKPYAFYDPGTSTVILNDGHLQSNRTPSPGHRPTIANPLRGITTDGAAYAMDRIHVVPFEVGSVIKERFYPSFATPQAPPPSLCRLYFGEWPESLRVSRFFSAKHFALNPTQYADLCGAFSELESAKDVAKGMGDMLARIHWRAGFDARDVEFGMGGDGIQEITYYMRAFSKDIEDIQQLVKAHFQNDPYFPCARDSDPLFPSFKEGYLNACGGFVEGGRAFIAAALLEQLLRDTRDQLT
ncbi:hypothetical protein CALVIDRAFT_562483 [Calocera viscosa TUFC12733]|uniref:DUF3669 domain-containing protein n=1 Tax=Calocera viscosa (strain TUFC12733) TaxID=1330018 RepID=A0A167NUL0_CALVF|nr:hypothetical protein CALVIDRAFT_562483 [Calocera viscosa TUFC12733]